VSEVNFTPSSTEEASPESIVAGVPKSKIVFSGVSAEDGADSGLVPTLLVALTVNVYAVPLVSPVTVALVADALAWVGVCAAEPT
jgi:hypothetical protein